MDAAFFFLITQLRNEKLFSVDVQSRETGSQKLAINQMLLHLFTVKWTLESRQKTFLR